MIVRIIANSEFSKLLWNCYHFFLLFSLMSNNGSTGSCISSPVRFRDEYRIPCPCPLSQSHRAAVLSIRRSITRFHSKPDFSWRKIHEIPTSFSLVVFFHCVLLHRWASVNVAAGSSREVSGLWIYVRRSSVHPCHSSYIQKCGNHNILLVCVSLRGTLKKMHLMVNIFYAHRRKEIHTLNIAMVRNVCFKEIF